MAQLLQNHLTRVLPYVINLTSLMCFLFQGNAIGGGFHVKDTYIIIVKAACFEECV